MQTFFDLVGQIREDWLTHRRQWTSPGLWALIIYRIGNWRRQLHNRPLRWILMLLLTPLYIFVRNFCGIELPWTTQVGRRFLIEHQGGIVIHGLTKFGDGCIIRQGVTTGCRYESAANDAPKIGNNVSIGAGAVLLGSIVVGDNAKIGANAVVLHDVPTGHTAVGMPARTFPSSPAHEVKTPSSL